ncbi:MULTISPECIES: type II secretion system protein J [Gammaproteobacteria]|uniref:PulJ/GspJ family protein n=1 Tax=Gammaproteobacteria TaxID=1236 RepID=UPI000DCF9B68|nr:MULTISPECIES: prepilin-type N-terminal cleavage/methylation domain-containing protein [Gammaproteobacteria]RTE86131.1 prepilin-type N-terminal cleavage/methylation domain-containing protein [Aliidiomarina sp. B3213]TCZ91484.1 prepilin-type N-terminal cleavage/methylation domain-containing protein [Lysobacter sp. N42]
MKHLKHMAGFTLPEVMVAMTLGAAGAVVLEQAFSQIVMLQKQKEELRLFQLERLSKLTQWQQSGKMPNVSAWSASSSGSGWIWQWSAEQQPYARNWSGYWEVIPGPERLQQCSASSS